MTTHLEAVRKHLGLSQTEMAARLGMSLRAVQDIEGGKAKERTIHILAADRVSLARAVTQGDPMLATAEIRRMALDLAALVRGEPVAEAGS